MPTATRIELPRPAIFGLVAVLVLAVTFLVTKPGDSSTSISTPSSSAATTDTSGTGTASTTTTSQPAKPKQPTLKPGPGLPARVAHALNQSKVVVLFFFDPAASDDQATHSALKAARAAGTPRVVAVFQDVVARISAYRRVIGSLGISQSPAMVVIDRNRQAQLLQGYLDAGTIRQTVRDAL